MKLQDVLGNLQLHDCIVIVPGGGAAQPKRAGKLKQPLKQELHELAVTRIQQALQATNGQQKKAASLLWMGYREFRHALEKYGLHTKRGQPK